jgi:hypothetical protein
MTVKQADFLTHAQNMIAGSGGPIQPALEMPTVTGMRRSHLREGLIAGSWFDEGQLLQGSKAGELAKGGYTAENNALTALKRRGSLAFNRYFVWLL